ncbi:hypothetical protein IV81_GL000306 [Pediococcus stilesii]|uniref:Uncharacterized protein n=1 Tax=Pediococcus stilesii TaxID=331679 RepID=A0A0R2KW15_9LACO|nr:hypothetical protein IV81_GL000306 [Pediococcus stilesii]
MKTFRTLRYGIFNYYDIMMVINKRGGQYNENSTYRRRPTESNGSGTSCLLGLGSSLD